MPVLGDIHYHWHWPGKTDIVECDMSTIGLRVTLSDQRVIDIPLSWFPILRDASVAERQTFKVDHQANMIVFPLLNTEVSLSQILYYRDPVGESEHIVASASDDQLVSDAIELLAKAIRLGQSPDAVVTMIREKLADEFSST